MTKKIKKYGAYNYNSGFFFLTTKPNHELDMIEQIDHDIDKLEIDIDYKPSVCNIIYNVFLYIIETMWETLKRRIGLSKKRDRKSNL